MSTALDPEAEDTPRRTRRRASGGLGRYILVRFLLIIPTVLILMTMVFFLMRITGDPITAALGGRLTPDQLAQRRAEAGYDRPLIVQYFDYLGGVLRGDFGTTYTDNTPVTEVLTTYGAATFELVVYSLVVALLLGVPLGMIAARTRDRWPDAVLRIIAILGYATPVFFVGLLLKLVFSVGLGWLPVAGRLSTSGQITMSTILNPSPFSLLDALRLGDTELLRDVLGHAVLPAVALGILTGGVFLRLVRTNMIGTLEMQYIESARSRGVAETRLTTRHGLRPALIPIITVMGMQVAMMLGGAVLTETTFEWNGLGYMLAEYMKARDYIAVQGIVMMLAVIVALSNFVVDVIAALIDPRVRY
ncbi:ABC-type dipeptide/oligopeptide/nickel transport system, permease component [Brachybacterium faecium DSM 4810]|uniref:ABC-type dipeptide/oligopeptide/nickel transport system, permease component n=1 Tax=Brachybacterium faecium (strain ATCC 43885 / DSM 4810 / JCM 11609 / LMG 19847 / NBRC 14762 / NCIMB 9860 / 6-10) TaxID=446465 RepID=C7MDG6_BRAFD|nr:ABC-type dipeptide/oligopeptide/nickel transport system, permease component [Brachybacterium faecium DSM 4810]